MRKKRIILKRSISALVIGAVTISILAGATSASSSVNADDATASVAVFENLLNDRSFVVDTFTQDTMPESNPYGRLDGVANTDYLSTDFLKQYENDPIFKSGVSLYYRMNHTGETISEIPSVLLDVFATDADWTKFCAGAKSKNYDSLLTSIYQNDYKSVSGNSIGSEEEGMQTLRAYSDLLDNSKTKDASKWLNDYLGAITDVNDIDKYNYLLKNTELYDENLTKYVSNVKKTLLQASKNSDGKKEMKDFSDLYEAQFYADYGAGDIPHKWDDQYKTMQIDKYGSKIKKIAKSVKTVISTGVSTVNNIVMMENLYRNQESMHDTLVRVRSNATKNNDNTFIRASSSYLSLLESDELGDNVIRSAALKSIYDYGSDELGKYVWDTAKGGARDEAAIMVARKTGMDTLSSKMAVSAAVGRANAILAVGKDLINYGTGFDDVCEKIYLMKYLQEIKQYAVDAFNDDKNNYNKYKSQADMKNMDIWASAAIDDLQFIKRIVLLQNDLGYQTANAQIGSKYGEILSWIDGCNDAAGLEARYTNLQNALVDTTINPVSTNPISVDEGCTLQIIHSTDSDLQTYAVYTNRSGQKCSIAEFENVMLAGIRINGGTLKISDQSKEEMKFNGLFVTDKAGNLEITGNGGEIYVGRLDINGFLQINDKCSKKINVASNLNIRNYVSIKNMDIHVAGNCNVAGSLEFASSELVVDGNMEADNGYLQMQDTEDKLLVKGNLTLGETYGSSKGECLTNGTVEVKGDFTSNYKETGSNWYGYYETNMHKTIFSGEKTQKISFKEPSQVNGFNDNLELQNNNINFVTPLYSLTVNNDMTISKTEDLQIVTQLIINNGSFVTTGNVEANMLNINNTKENQIQGNLNMTGTVVFKKGSLEVGGNAKFDNGYLQMKDTEDKLVVKGNMTLGETYGGSESDCLTNGTVEVKGDFTSNYKETGSNWYGYYETNTHKTIFSGEKTQKISFKEASQVNGFSDKLELQNNDINFATPIYNVKINQDTQLTNTEKLMITGTLNTGGYKFATTGNIDAERLDMGGAGVEIAGDVAVRTMNVSGSDNLIKGNLMVNGGGAAFKQGSLEVGGNAEFNNGFLQMQDTEDKLLVKGNLALGETYGSSKGECLTNGTVEVKGDFTSNYKETGSNWYGYYETNMHKTIFSGEKTQKISFKEPSRVNGFSENLELQNTDINFATPLYSLTLNQDTVLIHTNLLKINEFLNLNGHKLATTGKTECSNVAENGGTLEENPKFGHNYYNQLKPADLKDHDIKYADEAWVCTSCGKIFTDAEGIVEYDPDPCKDGHTIVIDQGKAATCTTDGLTEGKHCSVCKTVLVPQEVIPASHNWEENFTIDKEPSCTTEGRKSIHCKKCGETKDEQVIPATGHDFTEWETIEETSCTKEGITQRRCKICGFTETKKLDKKAHEWGTEYTVDQPATFAADGSKSIHCKNCETISEAIAIPRINSVKISATAYTYSGGVKTPSVTVKDANGNALHNKTDYIVQYASGRKNVGTYKVIVTFKDNYSGKKTLSFTIDPKGTTISSLSKSKKAFTAKWKKQSAQTSGYQLLYSTNSKFKSRNKYVTVSSYKTTSKTIKKLAAKKKYYVKIRTYRSVSGKKYYSGWSAAKTVVTK
ncbi:hypothetical protein H8S07_12860 [Dorea sp. NSJ-36]|uniref:Fibronectin type-III domain-containing protein n=1 Tax=Dorea hominis TaxID=2763040 RepID=A0ABR7EXP8_9FIRM|nr:hypothetical protein [Dorea hominis]MBC5666128.1 hypothetical protein [Dorea hominis]